MVNKKTKVEMNNIPIYLRHKYWLFVGIFLVLYFIFFANWKVDLEFTAQDLEVKTIDNREDFENIIVKNIYDKIIESCEQNNNHYKYYEDWEVMPMRGRRSNWISFWSNKVAQELKWSSDTWIFWSSLSISDNAIMEEVPATAEAPTASIDFDWGKIESTQQAESVWFSQTNIQKIDVDEWDILKQTKDYIFYFSKNKSKIFIIKSPLNWEKVDINNVEIVFEINIPSNLILNPELFVNDSKLVYLASKTSYNNNNTIVWIYDISNLANKEVKLHKIFETKWEYFKSRLVNNKLYLISDYSMEAYKSKYCNILNNKGNTSSSFSDFVSFFTWIKIKWFWLNRELYDELKLVLESYSYKFNSDNLNSNWESQNLSTFKLFYTNKDLKESIENLNFNVVSVVDIEKKESIDSQTLLFWNLKNGEIHMTLDNLYLVNSYFKEEKWKCDYIDICYKEFASNNFTSISKISYSGSDLKFESTSIIPWKPLNQYSMDEDEWYFRIFTSASFWDRDASLYVFDNKLKLIWQIENIKPGEEFKSARFIWDKAFLVTFRQIDPLFVIDLHVPSSPKIIWELHIPWYSTYLHPYGKVWNQEYLIWLWKENNNVKIDLYEINYDVKTIWDQIELKQKQKFVFTWSYSQTPAETNPRAFVWDDAEKLLYLPIEVNNYANRICYDVNCNINNFYWLKSFEIDIEEWITEIDSEELQGNYIIDSRVWYYKTWDEKALFFVNWNSFNVFQKWLNDLNISF